MAQWILQRPAECANLGELRVAELLAHLPDDWFIRWGFFYEDDHGVNREGDFLVLGPHGGLLVLEVKAGSLDAFPATGRWDSDDHDNPLSQLDAEWKAVVDTVNAHKARHPALFVGKALALPQIDLAPDLSSYHGIPRGLILSAKELRQFTSAWAERFSAAPIPLDGASRAIFFETFGKDATPKAIRHFIDEADRALLRHTEGNYELLTLLADNRQFMVKGGIGSGKTWLAFELACRWAEQGTKGSRVLFLCYNLALTDFLKELTRKAQGRGKPCRGTVQVMSWEELAKSLLQKAGLPFEVPAEDAEKLTFFTHTLPQLMAQVVQEGFCCPEFDALIVDEAQDHDTDMLSFPQDWQGPGWWGIYWKLLKEGTSSRAALFYDPAQRPAFRPANSFEDASLYAALRANPVRIHLHRSVRYTRPILAFLKSLARPAITPMVDSLQQRGSLPEGPNVQVGTVARTEVPRTVSRIIEQWVEGGLCRPEEILLLSLHGRIEKSALAGCSTLGGCLVMDYLKRQPGCISRTSVNKAKGLDALAVIMVDFPPFETITQDYVQASYFMGASRARQLLAIVHSPTD